MNSNAMRRLASLVFTSIATCCLAQGTAIRIATPEAFSGLRDNGGRLGVRSDPTTLIAPSGETIAGIVVAEVFGFSPLSNFNIAKGDIVYLIDGLGFKSRDEMSKYIASVAPGETMKIAWMKADKKAGFSATFQMPHSMALKTNYFGATLASIAHLNCRKNAAFASLEKRGNLDSVQNACRSELEHAKRLYRATIDAPGPDFKDYKATARTELDDLLARYK